MNTKLIRSSLEGALVVCAESGEVRATDGLWALNTLESVLTELEREWEA